MRLDNEAGVDRGIHELVPRAAHRLGGLRAAAALAAVRLCQEHQQNRAQQQEERHRHRADRHPRDVDAARVVRVRRLVAGRRRQLDWLLGRLRGLQDLGLGHGLGLVDLGRGLLVARRSRVKRRPSDAGELHLDPRVHVRTRQVHAARRALAVGAHDDAGVDALRVQHEGHEGRVLLVIAHQRLGADHALDAILRGPGTRIDRVLVGVVAVRVQELLDRAGLLQVRARGRRVIRRQGVHVLRDVRVSPGVARRVHAGELRIRVFAQHRRAQRVAQLPGRARRQGGIRPQVVVQAILLLGRVGGGGVKTQDRHLADRGYPGSQQLRGRHRGLHARRVCAAARDRRPHAAVSGGAVRRVRDAHAEGRPVVHVHRAQAHARLLGHVGHADQGFVLEVLVVVAVAGQRRGVLARVHGRLDDVASDDALRGRGSQQGGRGDRRSDHHAHHERTHAHAPPHVHDLA